MIENINWYPGHMKKTRELIAQNLKAVDVVAELLDARIPAASRNPIIGEIVGDKPRIVILNKSDLADPEANKAWKKALTDDGGEGTKAVVLMNAMTGQGSKDLVRELEKLKEEKAATDRLNRPLRLMVLGVPNVGKSSFINRMTGRKSTKVGDRPGVTKGKQWLTLSNGMQLLDTPGILWPKFEDQSIGLDLAFCGSIKDEIMDMESLALELIRVLGERYPDMLAERYGLDGIDEDPLVNMEAIAQKRGFIMSGKRIDYERCARTVLDEFRAGRIGRITLESPGK